MGKSINNTNERAISITNQMINELKDIQQPYEALSDSNYSEIQDKIEVLTELLNRLEKDI